MLLYHPTLSGSQSTQLRAAFADWIKACQEYRCHFAGSGAITNACDRLIGLVLEAHHGDPAGAAVAVDLGERLLVVGPHHANAPAHIPEEGPVLIVLAKSRIVRA